MAKGEIKRSVSIAGHRTSVSLEPEFWDALKTMAEEEALSLGALIARIDAARAPPANLSRAIRLAVLAYFRAKSAAAL
jgi:predicted DNA-binding ribbon-helix-helix protein